MDKHVQCYITCEVRFATVFRYHLRFLLHINGETKLNLPYYLLKSIEKMIARVRNHPEHRSHSVFRHGLIRILINYELGKTCRSWQHFIFWSGFGAESRERDGKEMKKQYRRKKRKSI